MEIAELETIDSSVLFSPNDLRTLILASNKRI